MSQYYTPFRIDEASTSTNSAKFQTFQIGVTASTSTSIISRRIMITTAGQPTFVAFGSAPVPEVNVSFLIPPNYSMIFNFKSGDKVAAITAGIASSICILDLD